MLKQADSNTLPLLQPNSLALFILVQDGVAGVWTTSLHFQRGSMLDEGLDRGVGQKVAKKGTLWVTDCVVMSNCNKLVLSTNSRELMFYDISTTLYTCQFRLHGKLGKISDILMSL